MMCQRQINEEQSAAALCGFLTRQQIGPGNGFKSVRFTRMERGRGQELGDAAWQLINILLPRAAKIKVCLSRTLHSFLRAFCLSCCC